jgi:hypothetical protein
MHRGYILLWREIWASPLLVERRFGRNHGKRCGNRAKTDTPEGNPQTLH